LPRPLPPWPRRLVLEVFRCRLAQVRPKGLCKCAPSVLSFHLAARRRRLSVSPVVTLGRIATILRQNGATCLHGVPIPFDALRKGYGHSDLAVERPCERALSCDLVLPCIMVPRPRCLAISFAFARSTCCHATAPDVAIRPAEPVDTALAARPGFVGCPHALFAPHLPTCQAYSIPAASLGFLPSEV